MWAPDRLPPPPPPAISNPESSERSHDDDDGLTGRVGTRGQQIRESRSLNAKCPTQPTTPHCKLNTDAHRRARTHPRTPSC